MFTSDFFNEDITNFQKIKRGKKRKGAKELLIEQKALKMTKGAIWGVYDKAVPFDWQRKKEDYKENLRPVVMLEYPWEISDYGFAWVAPGTSVNHDKENEFVLKAEVPPENLEKTTWFLIKYDWLVLQRDLEKKFTELTTENKEKLNRILKEMKNVG